MIGHLRSRFRRELAAIVACFLLVPILVPLQHEHGIGAHADDCPACVYAVSFVADVAILPDLPCDFAQSISLELIAWLAPPLKPTYTPLLQRAPPLS